MPGPLFTFAAWLGAVMEPAPNGVAGAAIALVALFLPGFLILIGALPFWDRLRRTPWARSSMQGANAAVVGMPDFALAVVCFMALMAWKAPPWIVVVLAAAGGVALSLT